jgi:hypothetical protein
MVAEAAPRSARPKNTPKGKMVGRIDLLTRSQARNLYVIRQLSAQEVATQTGLTPSQVYNLADREQWTKTRAEIKRKSAEALRARDEQDIDELVDAVAIKSSVLSLGTLDNAIEELKTPGEFQAKNLQALSVAAKNFVGLYREAKNLNVAKQDSGSTVNVMFVGALPRSAERTTVNVTPPSPDEKPAIDVATEASK